ncbi:MAG: nickel pincer cofactor biosynthesis protein LarB [Abditibacteriaceae bacterium]
MFETLRKLPFEDLGFARVDHHRALRQGFPEVIYCEGKSPLQVAQIAQSICADGAPLLATRADKNTFSAVCQVLPDAQYDKVARIISRVDDNAKPADGEVAVVCAGTSDLPVAEEAAVSLEVMGCKVSRYVDVGVAGLHRLLAAVPEITKAQVIIAVAGMEGAMPAVLAGLVAQPVIAVPTSVGYGASFGGLAALLGMLNSCSSGVTVVNIDNGFGAAMAAWKILRAAQVPL